MHQLETATISSVQRQFQLVGLLSAVGVHPRTAMAAMRHSRIELTMNYYTDPILLDVAGAVGKLRGFSPV
jgi:hypothetical protein